jgi:hypothetical protein
LIGTLLQNLDLTVGHGLHAELDFKAIQQHKLCSAQTADFPGHAISVWAVSGQKSIWSNAGKRHQPAQAGDHSSAIQGNTVARNSDAKQFQNGSHCEEWMLWSHGNVF